VFDTKGTTKVLRTRIGAQGTVRIQAAVTVAVAALLLAAGAAGCSRDESGGDNTPKYSTDPKALNIVAGSEQASVLETVVKPWCGSHGYSCTFTLKGSVDQARLLAGGSQDFDAYWFASTVFLQVGDRNNTLQDVKAMFLTPVVYAGWKSEMDKLGLVGKNDVAIGDILTAVESGKTKVWVTNPTQSNSGATVLFGFMNYFAGNGPGQGLTQQQLDSPAVDQGITRFIRAMDQTPPSTGTLMNECVDHPDACRTVFTYEDLVIEKNQELVKAGREPLYTVYPRGSLAISDAPLGFFPHRNDADAGKKQALGELQAYLLTSQEAQAKLLQLGRRPATSIGLSLDKPDLSVFNPDWGIQANLREQGIQFPATAVIQAGLDRYQTHYRRPVAAYYCLDGSGSMADNGGWAGVEDAAHQIFDQDKAAANFLQTHPDDRTTVAIFNTELTSGSPWTVDGNDPAKLADLTKKVVDYNAGGGTNMYTCLQRAASDLRQPQTPDRKRLVILMTDGVSNEDERSRAVNTLKDSGVPVIAIAFGDEVDERQLREVASATGGAYFAQQDLVTALRQAAGYK
jgi:Ca-activated chloride channel homolog